MLSERKRGFLAASLVVMAVVLPAGAQLQVGDNVSMKLNGNVSFGYNGDYSNVAGSDHSMSPSGNADLNGFYYSPGFLAFDVQPFYNQSRINSTYQSTFQSTGVTGSASIFSGSHFPGTVSYNKVYNGEGGFSVPGVGNLTTHGNSSNLALGWGIRIPDYPTVSFQFADGDNTSSVFGTNANTAFRTRMFGVVASDTWAGFNLGGGFHHNSSHALTPELLPGTTPETSDTSSNSFDVNATHKLPLHGTFSAGAGRSDINVESSGERYNGTIDTASSGVDFEPIQNLNVGVSTQYTNNLEGNLYQPVITAGGIVPTALLNYSTHSLDINSHASYVVPSIHLTFGAGADRRQQTILGTTLSADIFSEMVTYGADFLGGFFNASAVVTETQVNTTNGSNSLGQFDVVSYMRRFQKWNVSGSVNYSHDTQTSLIGYTSSGYGYSGGIGRKLGTFSYLSFSAVGTKTHFSTQTGSDNSSQNYAASLTLRRFSASGSYGKADGTSILTPTGLSPISNPTPVLTPLQTFVFNGKSYSFGASTTPKYGLVLSGSYSKTSSSTFGNSANSLNDTVQLNTMLQYKVRQLWITGGYLKLRQGLSITGQPPSSYSSFFVGITRWFNFF